MPLSPSRKIGLSGEGVQSTPPLANPAPLGQTQELAEVEGACIEGRGSIYQQRLSGELLSTPTPNSSPQPPLHRGNIWPAEEVLEVPTTVGSNLSTPCRIQIIQRSANTNSPSCSGGVVPSAGGPQVNYCQFFLSRVTFRVAHQMSYSSALLRQRFINTWPARDALGGQWVTYCPKQRQMPYTCRGW